MHFFEQTLSLTSTLTYITIVSSRLRNSSETKDGDRLRVYVTVIGYVFGDVVYIIYVGQLQ